MSAQSQRFDRYLDPGEDLTVSEWCDKHRILSKQESPAEPGPFRSIRTPFTREIADTYSDLDVREVVVKKGTQIGMSLTGQNIIAYAICNDPAPMMYVLPTDAMMGRFSTERVAPMIESTPELKRRVAPSLSRKSTNTISVKVFPRGSLTIANAGAPSQLESAACLTMIFDECDKYEPGKRGHPIDLAIARLDTVYPYRKVYYFSTPTFSVTSIVEGKWQLSDQRRYFVPCPACGGMQFLEFDQFQWQNHDHETTLYECKLCRERFGEENKPFMLEHGEWRPTAEAQDKDLRGYHIPSYYSPFGWLPWSAIVKQFLLAGTNRTKLQAFVNLRKGEAFEHRGEAPAAEKLMGLRQNYRLGKAPLGALIVTTGVDVQGDRIEWGHFGWNESLERWAIDKGVIRHTPWQAEAWVELREVLQRPVVREDGVELPVLMMAVDTGYGNATNEVYEFCRPDPHRTMAVKGGPPQSDLIRETTVDIRYGDKGKTRRSRRALSLFTLGVHKLKRDLYGYLDLEPERERGADGEEGEFRVDEESGELIYPERFCHHSADHDLEYFLQLTAEELHTVLHHGQPTMRFEKIRERNEALDIAVYAWAAFMRIRGPQWLPEQWERLRASLASGSALGAQRRRREPVRYSGLQ